MVTTRSGRTTGNKRTKLNPNPTTATNNDEVGIDRLSTLPDALLVSILNHLPTETALSTSVLSHKWQHLWTQITHLSFTGPPTPTTFSQNQIFITGVDHIFNRLTSPKTLKFHLKMNFPLNNNTKPELQHYDSVINSWVRRVCSRYPEDISVILYSYDFRHPIKLPAACIFQCDTLVSLNMGQVFLYDLPCNENEFEINLPNLKKLVLGLDESNWKENKHLFTRLFKAACPLLEELHLMTLFSKQGYVDVLEIVCPNLKTLFLTATAHEVNVVVLINAPKLENLSIISLGVGFRIINQPRRLENFILATLDPGDHFLGYFTQAFKAISSVRFLDLNFATMGENCRWETIGLPVFQNLTKLRVVGFDFTKLHYLSILLKYCPNLEDLVLIMGSDQGDNERREVWGVSEFLEPVWIFSKLRVLQVEGLCGTDYNLDFLKYMLSEGSVLEKVIVSVLSDDDSDDDDDPKDKELKFSQKLFSYPRKSTVCEINFSSKHIRHCSK